MEVMGGMGGGSVDSLVTDPPAGIGFMGKEWDSHSRDGFMGFISGVMKECLRVLKPGAHGLVWAIPRTSHWTGMALEDAGFEVRDCVYHVFGSGFPKSLNISKSIDRLAGAIREPILDENGNQVWTSQKQGKRSMFDGGKERPATYPATYPAKQWEGWGTALKPAVECWWLVRKPISEKTIAENVLRWGTGGLNIDACRVGVEAMASGGSIPDIRSNNYENSNGKDRLSTPITMKQGRFPSHLIHDGSDEVVSGMGSASRFFYCAKASKAERNAGCEGLDEKRKVYMATCNGTKEPSKGQERFTSRMNNHHPTVKPIALMEYLIKLITPPNGTVLDPFMGSGSTGVAAKKLGYGFIGIEKEPEYFKIAEARINHTQGVLL